LPGKHDLETEERIEPWKIISTPLLATAKFAISRSRPSTLRDQQLSTEMDPPAWTLGIEKECEAGQEVPAESRKEEG
jgi:hypothetical protein